MCLLLCLHCGGRRGQLFNLLLGCSCKLILVRQDIVLSDHVPRIPVGQCSPLVYNEKNWSWCSNHAEFVVVLVCENLELSCSDYFCSLLATKSAAVGCVGVSGFKICILDDLQ